MADEVLLALSQSALYNSLEKNSSYDFMKYTMEKSYGPLSKQKVSVPISSGTPNVRTSVSLPRYGLVHALYLKLAFKITANTQYNYPGWSCDLIKRAVLSSSNREIETITSGQILQYILERSTNDNNGMFKRLCLFEQVNQLDTDEYIILYLPLPFSFFNTGNGYGSSKDLSFLQKLSVSLEWNDFNGSMRKGTQGSMELVIKDKLVESDGTAPVIHGGQRQPVYKSALMMNFINVPNEHRRALQRDTYRISNGKPLSCMISNTFQELTKIDPVGAGEVNKPRTIPVDLLCKHVIYQTRITLKGQGLPEKRIITGVRLLMSGRIIRSWNDTSEIEFECAVEKRYGGASTNIASGILLSDNVYIINHNIDNDPLVKCSGALSLKNSANPQIEIDFVSGDTAVHEVSIEHSFYSLVSIQGSDGSVQVSVSL